jgi:hypothetical protein
MKTSSLAFVVLAFTTLVPVVTQARPSCDDAVRYADSMHSLSEGMVREYRGQIAGRRVCDTEVRFLQTLNSLEQQCERLEYAVRHGEERDCLERTFSGVKHTFCSVRERASGMQACSCLRELMGKFDRTMDALADAGFRSHHDHHDNRRDIGFDSRRPLMPHKILARELGGLMSRR